MIEQSLVSRRFDPEHERFTVDYIARESYILIKLLRKNNKRKSPIPFVLMTDRDRRILQRWGLG
jgi:hypothetical protein